MNQPKQEHNRTVKLITKAENKNPTKAKIT